jgi:hypothetical protein
VTVPRRTAQGIERRRALADVASGHGADRPQPPEAYRSTECRIGTHDACTEAQREQPPPDSGMRHETCTCGSHDWRGAQK